MTRTTAPPARRALVLVVGIVALSAVTVFVAQRVTELPPANSDYTVSIASGLQPVTTPARAATLARQYLDQQTPELAAPQLHATPHISSVAALAAGDTRQIEPRIPESDAAAQPGRVVWIVRASGDVLNLHDLPWSQSGAPDPSGNIVIDDATGAILGVYPIDPVN